eukprot:TRINITY_DN15940_c0_g1_i6.p1 TRINITY_DN15940_c0_g1~~TRINITY_DN15940_c0_g1_i6.p1  ORF type:complete len:665 (+),score=221.46 TRINITY_DN15940_c0_g1_i6:296-2290(+)
MGCGSSNKVVAPQPVEETGGAAECNPVVHRTSSSSSKKSQPSKKEGKGAAGGSNNEDIRDKYELGRILGSGSFGQVREASLKNVPGSEPRAVKMIERDNEDGEWSNTAIFVREVGLLQQIKHENIIRYYDFYEDVHFLYVVMEICQGGEVFAKIVEMKRFSEKNAAILGQQMLAAIDYIHKLHIAHRDIKAENFMLAEPVITGKVKMIDFGMATKFEENQVLTELCGSPHYLAPELIGQKYNHKADVWAFGVLLYLLMYGHYPYDAKHPRDIMVKILTEPIRWQTKAKLREEGLEFLKKCLEHDPKKRITTEDALKHPWVLLADSAQETETLPTETIRSAHKRVTQRRKSIDPKIDEERSKKLETLNQDFDKGIRHGKRLGETPKEEFMSKPEFVRRQNKTTTAPSQHLAARRQSLLNLMSSFAPVLSSSSKKDKADSFGNIMPGVKEDAENAAEDMKHQQKSQPRSNVRATTAMNLPRRLSYIGAMTFQEEVTLGKLWEEKRRFKPALGVAPEPNAPPLQLNATFQAKGCGSAASGTPQGGGGGQASPGSRLEPQKEPAERAGEGGEPADSAAGSAAVPGLMVSSEETQDSDDASSDDAEAEGEDSDGDVPASPSESPRPEGGQGEHSSRKTSESKSEEGESTAKQEEKTREGGDDEAAVELS